MKEITVDQLKEKLDSDAKITILDVRFEDELEFGKIKYAIVIPLPELPDKLNLLNKDDEIIVYCRSGARSARAVEFLESQGFSNVSNLVGGILAWQKYDDGVKEY